MMMSPRIQEWDQHFYEVIHSLPGLHQQHDPPWALQHRHQLLK